MSEPNFRLTYATMYNPPQDLHTHFEAEVAKLKANLGQEFAMLIDGKNILAEEKFEDRSPVDTDLLLGVFQKGTAAHAEMALQAARKAARGWAETDWRARAALVRAAAARIDARIYEFGAVLALEVGKNRMEALADAAEAADLLRYAADQMEANHGFIVKMGEDPLEGYTAENYSILRPYGVWLVISPFNFPAALTAGPMGAALVTGNTVVVKPATDTPWTSRLIAECFEEAGFPAGVVNYVTGPGRTLGQALVDSPQVDGITFTGSYDVGMKIYRDFAAGRYPRPIILEMGGKNPAVVSRNADLEQAAQGIFRSAFGLQGQKCSATSRVLVEEPVYDELVDRLKTLTESAVIGDPTEEKTFIGPVANQSAYNDYKNFTEDLSQAGTLLVGGKVRTEGDFGRGFYCEPTIALDVPRDHPLWKQEMFLPITMVQKVPHLEAALEIANEVDYGLTAGIYGTEEEVAWFFKYIEAGVAYANRPQGATTGAWPGFQPFGGWKGSGSTGKNAGGPYYLQEYLREQVNTVIR
ncbi:MAG: aldehyde dehydrogenase family protein [Anaerolineales bacterium]|nr:aldehyde dehydrogenase family protein [Anaerolineales bacterium]